MSAVTAGWLLVGIATGYLTVAVGVIVADTRWLRRARRSRHG